MNTQYANKLFSILVTLLFLYASYRFTKIQKEQCALTKKANDTQFDAIMAFSFISGFLAGLVFIT